MSTIFRYIQYTILNTAQKSAFLRVFSDRIYRIFTDFYLFLFTVFVPVNPV